MNANSSYYYCSECRKSCEPVERDFGIGAYEFWGAAGADSHPQEVSGCCDGDLLTAEELEELIGEETPEEN